MRTIIITLLALVSLTSKAQTTYTYTGIGDWSDTNNWSPSYPGTFISEEEEIIISEGSEATASRIIINGSLTNFGFLNAGYNSANNGTITNLGELTIPSTFTNKGSMTNQDTGIMKVSHNFVITPDGTLYSNFANEGTFVNHGELSISYFKNNGSFENTNSFKITNRLFGSNTAHIGDFLTGGFPLLPGDMESPTHTRSTGIGTYVFNDNLILQSNTRLAIDIQSDTVTDLLDVGETITLSGTLKVNWVSEAYEPEIGTTYTIITAHNIIDTFTQLDLPDIAEDKMLIVRYRETEVILEVIERVPFVYTGSGDWKDTSNWSPHYPGTYIPVNDQVIISKGSEIIVSEADQFSSELRIEGSLTVEGALTSNIPLSSFGTITNNNIFNAKEIKNNGTLINNADFNAPENVDEFVSEFVNEGTLENNGSFYANFLINNATFENNSTAVVGVLTGINSTHNGDFEITGSFRPGNDTNEIGSYRFDDNVTFTKNSQTTIDIEGFTAEHDHIQIQGNTTLSGDLYVNLDIGIAEAIDLEIGTTYPIISANSITGCFDNFYFFSSVIEGEKTLRPKYTQTGVELEVVAKTPFTYSGIGAWEEENNWEPFYPGTALYRDDEVIIAEGAEVTADNLKLRGTLTNNGSMSVASISNDGTLNDIANSFVVTERLSGGSTSHSGTFEIAADFLPKRYNFENDVTFLPSSHTFLNFEAINPSPQVLINGATTISGTLSIKFLKEFNLNIGKKFDIITADNVTGTFDVVNFPDLGPDQLMIITYSATRVSLEVIARVPFVYTGIGIWENQNNWSPRYPGKNISTNDEIQISEGSEIEDGVPEEMNGKLINEGSIRVADLTNNGTIINNGLLDIHSFVNNGAFQNNNELLIAERLIGDNQSHYGDIEVSWLFSPGFNTPYGSYTFNDNVTFSNFSRVNYDISGDEISTTDVITVEKNVILSGTLSIQLLGEEAPYTIPVGTVFTIVTANSISGAFNTIGLPNPGPDREFVVSYESNKVTLEVVSTEILNIENHLLTPKRIILSPVPTNNTLTIQGLQFTESIFLYSLLGKQIQEYTVNPKENTILVDYLSPGHYFIRVRNNAYSFIKN